MKKLGIDVRALCDPHWTGVGRYVHGMLRGIAERYPEVVKDTHLFAAGRHADTAVKSIRQLGYSQIITAQLPNKLLNAAWMLDVYPSHRMFGQAEYVWLPNANYYTARSRVPYAITVHDVSFMRRPEYFTWRQQWWHKAVAFCRLVENADRIITVSEHTKRDIMHLFPKISAERIGVIYPGTEHSKVQDSEIEGVLQKYGIHRPYLLFVGTIEVRKNINAIVNAFQILSPDFPQLQLVLVGKRGKLHAKLWERILDNPSIRQIGYISDAEKHCLYAGAEVLVWPSWYEGYGFPPLESMMHGTPVVTSYRSSLPEVMGDAAWYVNPHNTGEVAAVIKNILQQPSKNVSARDASWDRAAEELIKYLQL